MSYTQDDIKTARVTGAELKLVLRKFVSSERPVTFNAYYSFDNLIDEGIGAVLRNRNRFQKAVVTDEEPPVRMDETVTVQELIAAFQRRGFADFTSPVHVTSLVNDIKANREPEWRYGDVVKDRLGVLWRRESPGTHPWTQFGTQARYRHESPVRPLKKVEV